ncbi:hypothetical protein BGX26_006608, partial [Mortierella sp. AD094]
MIARKAIAEARQRSNSGLLAGSSTPPTNADENLVDNSYNNNNTNDGDDDDDDELTRLTRLFDTFLEETSNNDIERMKLISTLTKAIEHIQK